MACLGLYVDNRRRKDDWTTCEVHGDLGSCANGRDVFQMMMKSSTSMLSYPWVRYLTQQWQGIPIPSPPLVPQPQNALPSSYLILGYYVLTISMPTLVYPYRASDKCRPAIIHLYSTLTPGPSTASSSTRFPIATLTVPFPNRLTRTSTPTHCPLGFAARQQHILWKHSTLNTGTRRRCPLVTA